MKVRYGSHIIVCFVAALLGGVGCSNDDPTGPRNVAGQYALVATLEGSDNCFLGTTLVVPISIAQLDAHCALTTGTVGGPEVCGGLSEAKRRFDRCAPHRRGNRLRRLLVPRLRPDPDRQLDSHNCGERSDSRCLGPSVTGMSPSIVRERGWDSPRRIPTDGGRLGMRRVLPSCRALAPGTARRPGTGWPETSRP